MPREHEDWVRQLYLTHAPDLYRAARYRLQDPELAYDLTQEVFLTLLDKQAQVKHHPNPAGWLWKTLQYKLGHAFSRQAVRAKYEAGQADPDWLPAPLPATGGTLDEILPRQLPERDRPRPWGWPRCCRSSSPPGTGKFCSCSTRKGCPTRRSPSVWGCRFPPAAPGSTGPGSGANIT